MSSRAVVAERTIASPRELAARSGPLSPGQFRFHLIDVGTGLAVLIESADSVVLFDGGSADDKRGNGKAGSKSRLVAYLAAVLGRPADPRCVPLGDSLDEPLRSRRRLDLVVLSHAHEDHGSLLDDVFECFEVNAFWDTGVINHAAFYRDVWQRAAERTHGGKAGGIATSAEIGDTLTIRGQAIGLPGPTERLLEGQTTTIGAGLELTVLHAGTEQGPSDFNQTSIVLRVAMCGPRDDGCVFALLVGDAESGPRAPPSAKVGDVEAHLLEHWKDSLDVDILQVGHHGSMTSSRMAFLEAVSPRFALVSAGPKAYHKVVLPDREVITALEAAGAKVLRTDIHDADGCPVADRIGVDDERPGGCDNWVLDISFADQTRTDCPR